jgi:hypothetical protein
VATGGNESRSTPQPPFGGYRHGGVGRELGPQALEAFVETKAIHIDLSGRRDARPYDVLLSQFVGVLLQPSPSR